MIFPKMIRYIFTTLSIIGTLFFVSKLLLTFSHNEDSSKLIYKNFGEFTGREVIYPMFSICIATHKNKSLVQADALSMENLMKNFALKEDLVPLENKLEQNVTFQNVSIHLRNIVDTFMIEDLNGNKLEIWENHHNQTSAFPFYKSYQDPKIMCFSWNTINHTLSYVKVLMLKETLAKISSKEDEYYLFLYLSNNHQLIRNMVYLHREDFWFLPKRSLNQVRIDVTGVSMLRLRHDAKTPCDQLLKNDDVAWMQHVAQEVGCVPIYWTFLGRDHPIIPTCNSTEQYHKLQNYFARKKRNKVYEVFDLYAPPCTRMRILTSVKFLEYHEKDMFKIDVRYLTREFEEIQNVRDIDVESLIGNIGGYIGMILGVSILQISYFFILTCQTLTEKLRINK